MSEVMYIRVSTVRALLADVVWRALWFVPMLIMLATHSLWGADPKPLAVAGAGADAWANNPQAALNAVLADNQKLIESVNALIAAQQSSWIGWAVGGVGVLVGVLKVFNGPAGALAETLWAMIAPKLVKDAEKKRDVMADGFIKVAEIMRSFPADTPLGQVIDKLDRRLPEAVKHAYREWEAHEADDRPDSGIADPVVVSNSLPAPVGRQAVGRPPAPGSELT